LERAFVPLLRRMGADVALTLERCGFYPAGGGQFSAVIEPCRSWSALHLRERGGSLSGTAHSLIASVPATVAKRELAWVGQALNWGEQQLKILQLPHNQGPGNVLLIALEHEHVAELFAGFGARGVSAEAVAKGVVREVKDYLASGAAVGSCLADQLLLPMALAGAGSFTASRLSQHCITNAQIIGKFLPVSIATERCDTGFLVQVSR
jgi:RNA 3'-terminal phosphate cyclase (ATP)